MCGCDKKVRGTVEKTETENGWEWGGCSDNVKYGYDFARRFMDPPRPKDTSDTKKMLTFTLAVHNNEVGRRVSSKFALYKKKKVSNRKNYSSIRSTDPINIF